MTGPSPPSLRLNGTAIKKRTFYLIGNFEYTLYEVLTW